MAEQQSNGAFLLEGRTDYGRRWRALARPESYAAAFALFERAARKFPRYRDFRMWRGTRVIWKNFRD